MKNNEVKVNMTIDNLRVLLNAMEDNQWKIVNMMQDSLDSAVADDSDKDYTELKQSLERERREWSMLYTLAGMLNDDSGKIFQSKWDVYCNDVVPVPKEESDQLLYVLRVDGKDYNCRSLQSLHSMAWTLTGCRAEADRALAMAVGLDENSGLYSMEYGFSVFYGHENALRVIK